ncbi:Ig domain-containing protein, partial [Candidatus Saccharibacteria bacterium]|nr:Ig domain-containing protein [Candidatus Saccharibacteria bacterium]
IAGHNDPLLCPRDDGDEETELMDTIKNILDVVYFWVGILDVIFIVVGGITIQTSNGESEKIKRGKNTITYSVVGLVVVLAAFAITNFTIDALDGKSPTNRVASSESESDPPSSDDDRKKVKSVVTVKETKLYPGQQISLKPRIIPDYANNKLLSYSSSDNNVATADDNGKVFAKKAGTTVITIKSADGPEAQTKITVMNQVVASSIQLSETRLSLQKGKKATITATVIPRNAVNKTLKWESSDPKIATVTQSGVIKGIKDGKATITVSNYTQTVFSDTGETALSAETGGKTVKAKIKVTVSTAPYPTTGSMENTKYHGGHKFRRETMAIIEDHRKDFYYYNYSTKIKKRGGYTKYVKDLGGIFSALADQRKIKVRTAADFQAAAEYVWGLWTIWGPDYGASYHRAWGYGAPDGFYEGLPNRESMKTYNNLSINEKLKPSANIRTNCNASINTFIHSTDKRIGAGAAQHQYMAEHSLVGKIRYVDELKVGDIVHFFVADGGWHHVAFVGEVYKDYVVFYDGGGRWIGSMNFKKRVKRAHTKKLSDTYSFEHSWFAVRMWDIDQSVTLKGLN